MPAPKTLRFRARGDSLVSNYEAEANGVRRYVGRRFDPNIGETFIDRETKMPMKTGGFVDSGEAETVPYRMEYVREAQAGCLFPADKETADFCGIQFDPLFGESPKVAAKGESK